MPKCDEADLYPHAFHAFPEGVFLEMLRPSPAPTRMLPKAATHIGGDMRTIIAIALASIGIAGCASNQVGESGQSGQSGQFGSAVLELLTQDSRPGGAISTALFGPNAASESDMSRITELAWTNYQQGVSMDDACSNARSQLRIRSQIQLLDISRCKKILEVKEREHAHENRLAMIRANRAEIETVREAADIYEADDGLPLASRPLVKPDNRKYVVYGVLDAGDGLRPNSMLIRSTEFRYPRYAYVQIDTARVKLPPTAQAEASVFIVGNYVSNMRYKTANGSFEMMPVFKAIFVRFPD